MYCGDSFHLLNQELSLSLHERVNLVFTSPPFPLNRKKKYGNKTGSDYLDWIKQLSPLLANTLSDDGSIVIEIGNAWNPGSPTMSTLPMESLLAFKEASNLHLCQEFIAYNPARLPSPAQWVNVERIRVKDSFTRIWWLAKTEKPYANNKNILVEYSKAMKKLLEDGVYNAGSRPSEHKIGEKSFLSNNKGAIPSNVLKVSNTSSRDYYTVHCKDNNINMHPARMPLTIPEFFIKFLTKKNDLVFDPFGGSNVTGYVANTLGRRWISFEINEQYIKDSIGRFRNEFDNDLVITK
jgi:site-specific DNA-methyltransferase (cytosine-N4-specific)